MTCARRGVVHGGVHGWHSNRPHVRRGRRPAGHQPGTGTLTDTLADAAAGAPAGTTHDGRYEHDG